MSPKLFEMMSKTKIESPHSQSRAAGAEKTQDPRNSALHWIHKNAVVCRVE